MNNLSNLIIPRINVNSDSSIDEAIELIKEFNFDAFILFGTEKVVFKEDAKFSLERFNFMKEKLQNNSKNKILFFVDAENGFGHRCNDYEENDRMKFTDINKELYNNGISFNLAPVVDINEFDEEILNERCYSSDPSEVVSIASLFIEAAYLNNVIPCIKHFPGHGAAKGDTHVDIVTSELDIKRLNSTHIKPFIDLINKVELVMTNHVYYSSIDKEMIPASMSRNVMGILRNADYKGLVLSDSIRMGALTKHFSQEDIIERFFLNGGDLILDPLRPKEAVKIVNTLYKDINNIEKKLSNINNLKLKARKNLIK